MPSIKVEQGAITLRALSKSYRLNDAVLPVLRHLDLHIGSGEVIAIVGPSGCGKTTLLRILAGLELPDEGQVLIDGRSVSGVGTDRAVIFQEPRLLPWLTAEENVAFGLDVRGFGKAQAREVAGRYINLVGLGRFAQAYPSQLSGGMAQRVGIARALTVNPKILLLDEPFGALDAMTKITMQEELVRIWAEEQLTMILVTHDLEEAIFLADRVLMLSHRADLSVRLIDVALPRPRNRSDAEFVAMRKLLMTEFGFH